MRKSPHAFAVVLVLLTYPTLSFSQDVYYVTQSGSGSHDGVLSENAWSVAEFNDLSGVEYAGSTFYFDGLITDEISPSISGTSDNYITLDGYAEDDTTFMNLSEETGRSLVDRDGGSICINVQDVSYMIVQDFEITDAGAGVAVRDMSHDVIVRRNFAYQINGAYYAGTPSPPGPYNVTFGGSAGQGNVAKNIGRGTADEDIGICAANNIIISHNHLYATASDWGIDGIIISCSAVHTHSILVEYNAIHDHNDVTGELGEDGIDMKGGAYDIIIRFNKIYNHYNRPEEYGPSVAGINVNTDAGRIYIYGNWFTNNEDGAVFITDREPHNDLYVFSNVIVQTQNSAIMDHASGGTADTHFFFNNTILESNSEVWSNTSGAMRVVTNQGVIFRNNIIYRSQPSESSYRQIYVHPSAEDNSTFDYNVYYWPDQTSTIRWGDFGVTELEGLQSGDTHGLPQEENGWEGDPGLVDIDDHDCRIASPESAVVDSGFEMGRGDIANITIQGVDYPVSWGVALAPGTDWSGLIPIVETLNRDDVGWDIGAYAFQEPDGDADADADGDGDADADGDTDPQSDADVIGDADLEGEGYGDGDIGEGEGEGCSCTVARPNGYHTRLSWIWR